MRPTLIAFALVAVLAACGGKSEAEKEREAAAKSGRGTVTCDGSAMSGETGLPADFPSIDGVTFVTSAQNGPTRAVDGYVSKGLKDLYEEYQSGMNDAGYSILFDEREEDDAEVSYESKDESTTGIVALRSRDTGIVALRSCDEDKTSVHITNRPS